MKKQRKHPKKILQNKMIQNLRQITQCAFFTFVLLLLGGCHNSELIVDKELDQVKKICTDVLIQEGFEISSQEKYLITSLWKVKLSPYQRQGSKNKANILLKQSGDKLNIKIFVEEYLNYTTQDYLNPQNALWVKNGRNRLQEKWLISLIKSKCSLIRLGE